MTKFKINKTADVVITDTTTGDVTKLNSVTMDIYKNDKEITLDINTNTRRDVMVDIETLGTGENSSIFQISAMSFDIKNGKIYDSINLIGDISKYDKLKVDGSTLKWWLNTDKELLSNLLNTGTLSEYELASEFQNFIVNQFTMFDNKDVYLWGNGILFDNAKLQKFLTKNGFVYPINYKNDRDVRTILELASLKSGLPEQEIKDSVTSTKEIKHDALDDTRFQIRLVHKAYNILMGEN